MLKAATSIKAPHDHPLRLQAWAFEQAMVDFYRHTPKITAKQFRQTLLSAQATLAKYSSKP
jgi:hypothetical protein